MTTPHETLLGILTKMQAAHRLYQTETDYEEHQYTVEDLQDKLLDILCPDGDDFDLSALAAPSPAPAPAEAERLIAEYQQAMRQQDAAQVEARTGRYEVRAFRAAVGRMVAAEEALLAFTPAQALAPAEAE
jgi:hypothetical protein